MLYVDISGLPDKVTTKQFAELIGYNHVYVQRMVKLGKIPASKSYNRKRIPLLSSLKFLGFAPLPLK